MAASKAPSWAARAPGPAGIRVLPCRRDQEIGDHAESATEGSSQTPRASRTGCISVPRGQRNEYGTSCRDVVMTVMTQRPVPPAAGDPELAAGEIDDFERGEVFEDPGRLRVCRAATVRGWGLSCQPDPRLLRHRGSAASALAKTSSLTVTCGSGHPA